jgi:hypothetical protein
VYDLLDRVTHFMAIKSLHRSRRSTGPSNTQLQVVDT